MNRKQRRRTQSELKQANRKRPDKLTPVSKEDWPDRKNLVQVFLSKKYLVQIYDEGATELYGQTLRLSISRTTLNNNGGLKDKLTWDELNQVKVDVGCGDWYGVEVYPPTPQIINVANMRHLWLMAHPPAIGWV